MLSFALFIMFKFELFIKEKEFERYIFDIHVKHELRLPHDKAYVSIDTLISEYREIKNNDYPSLSCAYHFGFPHRSITKDILIFNQNYQSYCRFRIEHANYHDLNYFGNALEEAKEIHKIYDTLDDALTDDFSLFRRRKALYDMRKALGNEFFYKGILPPPIPLWRFELFD